MNEQAILRQISAYLDEAEVDKHLQTIHQMQDYLHALQDGEKRAHPNWVNSATLILPEDFTDEMNKLSTDLGSVSKMLKQLDRIEEALEKQKEKLMKRRQD